MDKGLLYLVLMVLVMALVTFGTRLLPFAFFGNGKPTPKYIVYLGNYLPPAVMAMLIVYALKDADPWAFPYGMPELAGVAATVGLHLWRRNNLLSIVGGTLTYMAMVQLVF